MKYMGDKLFFTNPLLSKYFVRKLILSSVLYSYIYMYLNNVMNSYYLLQYQIALHISLWIYISAQYMYIGPSNSRRNDVLRKWVNNPIYFC